jgi:hypothetical protein|nr:MAG TPA: hypothetical protein [Caudoviricetes sp.]
MNLRDGLKIIIALVAKQSVIRWIIVWLKTALVGIYVFMLLLHGERGVLQEVNHESV